MTVTKKTLEIKEYFLPDFWNETALKSLQFRFQKINQVSFVAIISFSFLLSLSQSLLLFLLFSYYLFDYIFNLLFMIIILLFYYLFFPFFHFVFQVHFCSIFFICFLFWHFSFLVLQMSPSDASFACYYFYFYPYMPLVNSPRRTPRPSALPGNFMSLYLSLGLGLCLYYGTWAGQFHFSPPLYHLIGHLASEPWA